VDDGRHKTPTKANGTRRLRPLAWAIGTLVAGGVVLTACGGGESASPGVANLGSSTTTSAPAATQGGTTGTNDAVAYSECMRTHGVPNMPDPTSDGAFVDDRGTVNGVTGVDPNSSAYRRDDATCSHLLPNGGKLTASEQQQAIVKALKFSGCMQSHGIKNFPDPTTSGGGVGFLLKGRGVDPNSSQFQVAQKTCQSLVSGGP
jgi:hypothetical protein